MIKVKNKNLIFAIFTLILLSIFFIQNTIAYFSDVDNIQSNEINIPYATKVVKSNGVQLECGEDNVCSLEAQVDQSYSITTEINTNYPVFVRVSVVSSDIPAYDSNWLASTNIYSEFAEFIPEEANYDDYFYYSSIVQPSSNMTILSIFTINSTQIETIYIDVQIIQANAYGLSNMWIDVEVDDSLPIWEYRVDESLIVINDETVVLEQSGYYTINASTNDKLQLRFTYPFAHNFSYDSIHSTEDLTIILSESRTYNITLTILESININYKIVVNIV